MRIAGVIAEYNPFHNGHKHHLDETARRTGCDFLVVAMSGAFTQRGDPALVDKWTRARMALLGGADLVVELPALFAVRTADHFARGGVSLLARLGAEVLSFGCEPESLSALDEMRRALAEEPPALQAAIRLRLSEGKSHARARGEALSEHLGIDPETVNAPNTVLALEYLRAIRSLGAPMEALAVPRTGSYHSKALGEIASATAIREAIRGEQAEAFGAMPETSAGLIPSGDDGRLSDPSALDNLLLYRLRAMPAAEIAALADMGEGLEMRFIKLLPDATSREALLQALKCKRYTLARLNRLCAYALLGMDRALTERITLPPYARVLGFRERARPLMRTIADSGRIPLVTRASTLSEDACFRLECRATDLWGLTTLDPALRRAGRDYAEKVVIVP